MKKYITIVITALVAAATIAQAEPMLDQPIALSLDRRVDKVKFLPKQFRNVEGFSNAADGFPKTFAYWSEAEISYAVDSADEIVGSPSNEIVEQARKAFDKRISNTIQNKVKLWCLNFYEGAAKHMAATGEEINDDALPMFLEKAAAKMFPTDELMQRWFVRYASEQLGLFAEKWAQIKSEEIFASNAVNVFNGWLKQLRKKLTVQSS